MTINKIYRDGWAWFLSIVEDPSAKIPLYSIRGSHKKVEKYVSAFLATNPSPEDFERTLVHGPIIRL